MASSISSKICSPKMTQGVFEEASTMKIADALALAGDLGCYFVNLTDIDAEYKKMFCAALMAVDGFMCKTATAAQLQTKHIALVEAFAKLEINLPLYWCTSTRHHLSHFKKKIDLMGFFQFQSLLSVERYHVLLKSLARGTRNMVRYIGNHYSLFDISQTDWRMKEGERWATKAKQSSLAGAKEIPENNNNVLVKGRQTVFKFTATMFKQVQELWATEFKVFDNLLDRYRKETRRLPEVTLAEWRPRKGRPLTREEQWMKVMDDEGTVTSFFFIIIIFCFCSITQVCFAHVFFFFFTFAGL